MDWKQFILDNLSLFVSVASFLILLVSCVLSKRTKKQTALSDLVDKLPVIINDAESKGFIDGSRKLEYVLSVARTYLAAQLGIEIEGTYKYVEFITSKVEDILSTPHKKEN